MRKIITILLLTATLFVCNNVLAQTPNGINYQAVLRNTNNQIITNQNVGLRLSVLQTSSTGTVAYSETFNTTTNDYGVVNLVLGQGTVLSGSFSNIDWGIASYFVKVDVDFTGGVNYQFMGTSQLQSVPYALYAERVSSYDEVDGDTTNELQMLNLSNDTLYLSDGNWVYLGGSGSIWTQQGNSVFVLNDKVGVGTNNPTSAMHIVDTSSASGYAGQLKLEGGNQASISFVNDSVAAGNSKIVVNAAYNQMQFRHNGGTKMTIHKNGSVSIGTYEHDAKLKVKQMNSSDTTIGIYTIADGGIALKGKTYATTNNDWNNIGLYSELNTLSNSSGRAIFGNSYGIGNHAYAVSGESHLATGQNTGVRGVALSNSNNNSWQFGGNFEARGEYDTTQGVGSGSHYGVRAEAKGGGFNCGVRGFGLSHNNTNNQNLGGYFSARANWDNFNGAGQGNHYGLKAEAFGAGSNNYGIEAKAQGSNVNSNNHGGDFYGFCDVQNNGYNNGIYAVADSSTYMNTGVYGKASSNVGKYNFGGKFESRGTGNGSSGRNVGVEAWSENNVKSNYGLIGSAKFDSQNNPGVNPGINGVYGQGGGSGGANFGVHGTAWVAGNGSGSASGVYGTVGNIVFTSQMCQGVDGTTWSHSKQNVGVGGWANSAVSGDSLNYGVYGNAINADTNYGVFASATGYDGTETVNYGIFAQAANGSTANYAGFFEGDVTITGNLNVSGSISKASGTFKIDHPLDPENKYLVHSFVESPEMINVYSGNITTDANGMATVVLPSYFEAANKDFRYQLTAIGQFAQAIIKDEISANTFVIQTDKPNVKISWQVTAVRNDAYAKKHRIEPEQSKSASEQGKYLHPELYDKTDADNVYPKHSNAAAKEMVKKKLEQNTKPIEELKSAPNPAPVKEKNQQSSTQKVN